MEWRTPILQMVIGKALDLSNLTTFIILLQLWQDHITSKPAKENVIVNIGQVGLSVNNY